MVENITCSSSHREKERALKTFWRKLWRSEIITERMKWIGEAGIQKTWASRGAFVQETEETDGTGYMSGVAR